LGAVWFHITDFTLADRWIFSIHPSIISFGEDSMNAEHLFARALEVRRELAARMKYEVLATAFIDFALGFIVKDNVENNVYFELLKEIRSNK
jgi:hypothetical protein